jgi:hypothetical protein
MPKTDAATDTIWRDTETTWRDAHPWLLLLRTFRISVGLQVLLLATLGAVATSAGWRLAGTWNSTGGATDESVILDVQKTERERQYLSKWPGERREPELPAEGWISSDLERNLARAPSNPIVTIPYRLVTPLLRLFDRKLSWGQYGFYLFGGFWTLFVWSLLGTAIARIAVVQLGREDRADLSDAIDFARGRLPSVMAAALLPIFGVVILAAPIGVLGLMMKSGVGAVLAGLLWPFVIVANGIMAMILLGLVFGWPLINTAVAAEGSDAFDAISRSYAYTFQRPLRYLFYVLVASGVGLLSWLLVWGFSEAVIALGYWSASWGLGQSQTAAIIGPGETTLALTGMSKFGASLICLWVGVVRAIASGFGYSYFWVAYSGIYLLLRQDVDSTEWDEIYDSSEAGLVYGLPKLTTDESGLPVVLSTSNSEADAG